MVHNFPRQAAECYLNLRGDWECKVSCIAFQVRDRIGDGASWPPLRLSPSLPGALDARNLRQHFQLAEARKLQNAILLHRPSCDPVELCAVHRLWRSMSSLEMTKYGDYTCVPCDQCQAKGSCSQAGGQRVSRSRSRAARGPKHQHRSDASRKNRLRITHHNYRGLRKLRQRMSHNPRHQSPLSHSGRRSGAERKRDSSLSADRPSEQQQLDEEGGWQGSHDEEGEDEEDLNPDPETDPSNDEGEQPVLAAIQAQEPMTPGDPRWQQFKQALTPGDPRWQMQPKPRGSAGMQPTAKERPAPPPNCGRPVPESLPIVIPDSADAEVGPKVPLDEVMLDKRALRRAIFFTGPDWQITKLRNLDLRVNCLGFRDPYHSEMIRHHSGLHPTIRQRTRAHGLYSVKRQEVVRHMNQHLVPNNGAVTDEYRFGFYCRAGRHRSVSCAEEMATDLREIGMLVIVVHLNDHLWPCARG